ncbi:MAG: cell division ATP-binding protein FtsE [Bdellovibrionia bacterium]
MIDLTHVYKTYGQDRHALRDIKLQIQKGEFVFLTGPSGAGKSTLFKLITAFDRVTSGSIVVNGRNLSLINSAQVPSFRRELGVVFQDFKLLKDRSVFDNIALPLVIRGEAMSLIQKKVSDTLEKVGLSSKQNDLPDYLSGGEQQRVAIARAIIHQPALLVADEPTGNLDPDRSREIMDLFERVAAQGTTVFIASHDHELIKSRRKRTLKIENGILNGGELCTSSSL